MAAPTIEELTLAGLCEALGDPAPRKLTGTPSNPGFFNVGGPKKREPAAKIAVDNGWVEPTGEKIGKGASAKPAYRLTPSGIEYALANGETARILEGMLNALDLNKDRLSSLRNELSQTQSLLEGHRNTITQLQKTIVPPDISKIVREAQQETGSDSSSTVETGWSPETAPWIEELLTLVRERQRKDQLDSYPLPELYEQLSRSHQFSIGQFHDVLRMLVKQKKLRLHPFTGSFSELKNERYALLAAQEIKYYAESLD